MSRPRVLVLANIGKPGVEAALGRLRSWLNQHAQVVAEPAIRSLTVAEAERLPPADLGLVFGGDGTMLQQARLFARRELPLLGINFGKLGFLAEFSVEDLVAHWPQVISGELPISERMMVRVHVHHTTGISVGAAAGDNLLAMNEVTLVSGSPHRMMEMALHIHPPNAQAAGVRFRGNGAIIATPTGSTAYNLGNGGPIVQPELEAICFTPICANSLSFRPLLIGADHVVSLTVDRAAVPASLVLDGQMSLDLHEGDVVEVRREPTPLRLICHPQVNYWSMLGQKLHWVARP